MQKEKLPVLSVSQYVEYVNELVSLQEVLVEGEISNCRDIPGRSFRYFDIKDQNSSARCFQGFWKSSKVDLENGNQVRILGFPALQKNGTLVIDVREIMFAGEGVLMKAYLELKKKLEDEGLFDEAEKQRLPLFPKKIGLIAGKNSSAYHDVTAEIFERWRGATLFFLPSKVQGIYAKKEIVRAIRHFNQNLPVDVLILARGGGSMEDLQAFDSEEVAREIFGSKIPVISAIGHEDHWTISDFVSDVRAKTPTKAAQLAVPDSKEISDRLDYYSSQSQRMAVGKLRLAFELLVEFEKKLGWNLQNSLSAGREKLEELAEKSKQFAADKIAKCAEQILFLEKSLELLNPRAVLSRGYAVLETEGGRIEKISQLKIGGEVKGYLQDGKFVAKIEDVINN